MIYFRIAAALNALSLVLLYFGLTEPMMSLDVSGSVTSNFASFSGTVMSKNPSILASVEELFNNNKAFVGFLILFFSILVPIAKGGLAFWGMFNKTKEKIVVKILALIGKWSMADVFVVAILIAYLFTTGEGASSTEQVSLMGMKIPVKISLEMLSGLGSGFYFFTSYCLVSLAAISIWQLKLVEK